MMMSFSFRSFITVQNLLSRAHAGGLGFEKLTQAQLRCPSVHPHVLDPVVLSLSDTQLTEAPARAVIP